MTRRLMGMELRDRLKAAIHRHSLWGKVLEIAERRIPLFREQAAKATKEIVRLKDEQALEVKENAPLRRREDTEQQLFLAERRQKRGIAKMKFWEKRRAQAFDLHHQWGNIVRRRTRALTRWLKLHRVYGAGGWAPTRFWVRQRIDQGQDFEIKLNRRLRAPGDGTVIEWAHDAPFPSGFGDPYAIVHIETGEWAGRTVYLGHANGDVPPVGLKFKEGDKLSRCNNSLNAGLGWCELGNWPVEPWDGISQPPPGAKVAPLFKDVRA